MPAPPAAASCSSSALNTHVTVWPVLTGFRQPSHWSISVVDAVPVMGGGASCMTATVNQGHCCRAQGLSANMKHVMWLFLHAGGH